MKQISETENALVLRTDFSNQAVWERICGIIQKPVGIFRFRANVEFVDDVEYAGLTKDQLLELIPKDYSHSFIIVVDRTAILLPDYPLLMALVHKSSRRRNWWIGNG